MRPRKLWLSLGMALIFLSCARDDKRGWVEDEYFKPPKLSEVTELKGFESCQALENYFKAMMIKDMEKNISIQGGHPRDPVSKGSSTSVPSAPNAGPDEIGGEPDFTTTNVQEKGVDEADFVKNNRDHIFLLHQDQFIVFSARPAEQTKELARIEIQGHPLEMFVANKKAVIFSQININEAIDCLGEDCYYQSGIKITLLDLSNLTSPTPIRALYIPGKYVNSRRIKDTVHIVTYNFKEPSVPYPDCYSKWSKEKESQICESVDDDEKYHQCLERKYKDWLERRGCSSLIAEYKREVKSKSLADFVPYYYDEIKGGSPQKKQICSCNRFFRPKDPSGRGVISIVSLNLARPFDELKNTSVVMNGGTVYASTEALYIASPPVRDYWWYMWDREEEIKDFTSIHKFNIFARPDQALYVASGKVEGHILNQFSLGEYEGFLRVAVTVGDVSRMRREGEVTSINHVFVLEEIKNSLRIVGEIRDMAPNEKIYSARFMGKRGYVVTFKKVDPFFTLDLSDPYNPRIAGEWKGPGFSTYIHPMDEDHVLTIGRDTEEAEEGDFAWFQGVQLSIFDLSDFSDPKLLWKEVIGSRSTGSEALHDHRAFTYFGKRKVLAIPIELYEGEIGELTFIGLHVYRVDLNTGFELLGQVNHKDLIKLEQGKRCGWNWWDHPNNPTQAMLPQSKIRLGIRRSIIMGDYVYSISSIGIKVNLLDNPEDEAAAIPLIKEGDPIPGYRCYD